MTRGRALGIVLLSLVAAGTIGFLVVDFVRRPKPAEATAVADQVAPPVMASRRIKATLFYVAPDGVGLLPVERDVLFGQGTLEQAKRILEAQFESAPSSLSSAIPPGTKVRAIYVTDHGEAYVDVSGEAVTAHPGGSLNELLTVYTIVEALTANLPAVNSVQILVDGHEVDTLAGHVDLRQPLGPDARWVEPLQPGQPPDRPGSPAPPDLPPGSLPDRPSQPAAVGQ
jgi:hypothetical protein